MPEAVWRAQGIERTPDDMHHEWVAAVAPPANFSIPADPARGETVEVRAHVYLDLADGGFVIHEAGYEVSPRYRRHVATLTARVLLPTVATITADVEVTP
jgi:hypothetical protein